MKNKTIYYVASVIAMILWSASFIATKIAYSVFAPIMVGFVRFLIATVILGAVCLSKRNFAKPGKKDMKTIALSGLLGVTLYFAAENIGVKYTSASNASLIIASYPAITALFEFIIYRIKPGIKKSFGIALAFAGIAILAFTQDNATNPKVLIGNIILIATGIIWTFYNFTTRSVANKYSPVTLSFYQMLFGTIFFIPLVFIEQGSIGTITTSGVLAMIYLACGCSVAAFLLYNFGLRKLTAATSVSLMNLIPIFGLILSALILHETISAKQIASGIIVILGVILSTNENKKHRG